MADPAGTPIAETCLVVIVTTFDKREAAVACGRRLVEGALAACVQVDGPVTSIYRWQGSVEAAEEWRCTCKTTPARREACLAAILAAHPYETPQLTVAVVGATRSYAAWVEQSVDPS